MNQSKIIIYSVLFLLMSVYLNAQTVKIMMNNIRLDVLSDGENDWNRRKDHFPLYVEINVK